MITADLDRELAGALRSLAGRGALPGAVAHAAPSGTWRPDPAGDPSGFATAAPFAIAGSAGLSPAHVAAAVAGSFRELPWVETATLSGQGYLTIRVTRQALAVSAARMAAAGLACANSAILAGTGATAWPWPDLAAARDWQHAWQQQAQAMTGQFARAAGAAVLPPSDRERAGTADRLDAATRSPVADAVAYFGSDWVRYWLARTMRGQSAWPAGAPASDAGMTWPSGRVSDPRYPVGQAYEAAVSAVRWAADLGLEPATATGRLGRQLSSPAERDLLGLLSFLPVRVAAAARRRRPAEVPRYLEQVSATWLECRMRAPALPFGGRAAPADPVVAAARLVLAQAVAAVIGAGLALTGIAAPGRP